MRPITAWICDIEIDEQGAGVLSAMSHTRFLSGLSRHGMRASAELKTASPSPRQPRRQIAFTLHRVDSDQAHVVADAFLDAPRSSASALVRAAYGELGDKQPLVRPPDRPSNENADSCRRSPGAPSHTQPGRSCRRAFGQTECSNCAQRTSTTINIIRSSMSSIGGTYDRFRAVHDIVSHARLGLGFDRHGEFSAWLAEDRMYTGLARWALATELHAEHSVFWTTGTLAAHKATLLPADLVRASLRLRSERFWRQARSDE